MWRESTYIMKILVTGEEHRAAELRARLSPVKDLEIDFSDGDDEEDFAEHDCIFDLNFDDIPGVHFPGRARRAGINEVSGFKRNPLADIADDRGAIKQQIGGGLFLNDFSIEPGL